jgi:tetratricopeptide (TPR) repeat protein
LNSTPNSSWPTSASAQFATTRKHDVDGAIACYRRALELNPKLALAHYNLGNALFAKGDMDAAVACHRRALALDPKYAPAHCNLGSALLAKRDVKGAIACYRRALELDPKNAGAHINLGYALRQRGEFAESLAAFEKGHELGPPQQGWRYPSAELVRQGERLIELERRLPDVLQGKARPRNAAEQVELGVVSYCKKLYAASARFYAAAFAADANLPNDLKSAHRCSAAWSAALAGSGLGADAGKAGAKERARLRRQALDWLLADLARRAQHQEDDDPEDSAMVLAWMRYWRQDPALTGVRNGTALARLPAEEREDCAEFWVEVGVLLRKTGRGAK